MQIIGLSEAEQTSIFRVIATILWLGNVTFKEKDDGNSDVADTDVTDFVAYLMETKPEQVVKVLTTRVMETQRGGRRGEDNMCVLWVNRGAPDAIFEQVQSTMFL
jgi:myosin-1